MLTRHEQILVEKLGEIWNEYCELPEEHINEKEEFFSAIHVCQRTILARSGRRDMLVLRAQDIMNQRNK